MLPDLAVGAAAVGLILIMSLIYREVGAELGSPERSAFLAGAVAIVVVAAWHIVSTAGGAAH